MYQSHLLLVLELGAGAALPSLLASTLTNSPSVVTITDHPDQTIIKNLQENVSRNRNHIAHNCHVFCIPYIWGDEPGPVLYAPQLFLSGRGLSTLIHITTGNHSVTASTSRDMTS